MNPMKQAIARAALDGVRMEAGVLQRSFRFPRNFVGFAGHFPDMPVLPAIVQMLAALCVIEAGLGKRLSLAEVAKAKFLIPLPPDTDIRVEATRRQAPDSLSWSVQLHTDQGKAASFHLTVREAAA